MSTAAPTPDGVLLRLSLLELLILHSSVTEFIEAVAPAEEDVPTDPLDAWEREFNADVEFDEPDPLSRRLFPNAYPDDPQAAAEFRRYTEPEQRRAKVRDASLVADVVGAALHRVIGDGGGSVQDLLDRQGETPVDIVIADADTDPWLKTLTALRLRLGVELGVETGDDLDRLAELPDDDPRALQVEVFDWLGYVQESILESL